MQFNYNVKSDILTFDLLNFKSINGSEFKLTELPEYTFKKYKLIEPTVDGTGPILFNSKFGILAIGNVLSPDFVFISKKMNEEAAERIRSKLSDNYSSFIINKKDSIENYYIYRAINLENDKETVLLSQKFNCNGKKTRIDKNEKYNLSTREVLNIKIVDTTINTSLIHGLKIDDITISEPDKMPLLIINSCDGFISE